MFTKALVAMDLSAAERPILDCLPALQHWGLQHIVLVHIIAVGYGQGAEMAHRDRYEDWLQQCAQPLRDAGFNVDIHVGASGTAAADIVALADTLAADFIVVGSRSQNMLSKLFLGSVARAVLQQTSCPVLLEWIEPTPEQTIVHCQAVCTDTLQHLIFATDFSDKVANAEQATLNLAAKAKKVSLLHVLPEAASNELSSTAKAKLHSLSASIQSIQPATTAELLTGKAADTIAGYANTQHASLIIVGKHGEHWLKQALIGSTAARLAEVAGRPVLMLP